MKITSITETKEACFGCSACKAICPTKSISFNEDSNGFKVPNIADSCIGCGKCLRVCPANSPSLYNEKQSFTAMKNTDESVREKSASGGLFSVFAESIIKKNGNVYGVVYNNEFSAIHKKASSIEEINEMRGSKYVQSELGNVFESISDDLKEDKYVLFTGTSCQCDGLIHFLSEKKANTDKLITVAILCHGAPSPKVFKDHLNHVEKVRGKKIIAYNNREKVHGWHEHNECIHYEDGSVEWRTKLSQNFKDLFYSNVILRDSCYICPYASSVAVSDIVIGDFWGIEYLYPEFDDKKGTSVVIANTDKGREFIKENESKVSCFSIDEKTALKYNHHSPCNKPTFYNAFWEEYSTYGYEYVVKKYACYNIISRIKWRAKKELRRILVLLKIIRA